MTVSFVVPRTSACSVIGRLQLGNKVVYKIREATAGDGLGIAMIFFDRYGNKWDLEQPSAA